MKSRDIYETAKEVMPAGVSSPVRAYEPYPRYVQRGRGSKIYDVDGKEYTDYCMAFGPLILGHAHPYVIEKLKEQVDLGLLYGAPVEKEIEMAKLIKNHYPSMEMIRFVNTGTEATMSAIRLARGYTGKNMIIKIEGAFHGSHDSVLVKAGSGATTHGAPSSLGIPKDFAKHTLVVPFNNFRAMETAIKWNKGDLAGVILEPIMGNCGPILPQEGYLQQVREITERYDLLLIFDEVITGFRLSLGGAQEYYKVKPDITTLGKILGGGLPIGAFGGRKEIMEMISPLGKVYQAGTFSGNPLSLTAGFATIEFLKSIGYEKLNERGERIRKGLRDVLQDLHLNYQVQGIASMFQLFLTDKEVWNYEDAKTSDTKRFHQLFLKMLEKGFYLPPSQFETNFLCTEHSDEEIDRTIEAYEESLKEVAQ